MMPDWIKAALAGIVALTLASVAVTAQSGRSYSLGPVWWEAGRGVVFPVEEQYDNPQGTVSILNAEGAIRPQGHAFFEALGVNGRACVTCHQPANAMSVSTASVRERWNDSEGKDPIFAAVDGSNCPDLPQAAMSSHSLLLNRGLFRMALPWPPQTTDGAVMKPEFRIEVVRDPTGCNTGPVYGLNSANPAISVYRRPRVVANFKYAIGQRPAFSLMTDGREPGLRTQAITAALVHEQARMPPSEPQLRQIVDFEMQVFAAQSADARGGLLNEKGGPPALGPENLGAGRAGILSGGPSPAFSSFEVWRQPPGAHVLDMQNLFRASVARGSDLFSARCATCHEAGTARWMDIGTTNGPAMKDLEELPLFRITCDSSAAPHPLLGRLIYTRDPGRALISGKCADVGSIVMQQLRGLAARAPYFSSGTARNLREVVDFYDRRFAIGYSEQEKQDLVNFLSVL